MSSTDAATRPTKFKVGQTTDQIRAANPYHWPEYLIEAAALGTFMLSACLFCTLLEYPTSVLRQSVTSGMLRRCLMGVVMGSTAVALIYSPWGKRSGAQMNPSLTLGFLSLGRISRRDALFYIASQFLGGALGVGIASFLLGNRISHPGVTYALTKPGPAGTTVALAAEFVISFVLFSVVLRANAHPKLMRFTGLIAGALVCLYIIVEAPFSGMSMNPARSLASAVWSRYWADQWIYFVAPPVAMLLAAQVFRRSGHAHQGCAKLVHDPKYSCIFCRQPSRK